MANENLISAEIADTKSITDAIANIKTQLTEVLVFNLTDADRRELAKMGDKTLPFVTKSIEYADTNAPLVPSFLNVAEAKKDLALTKSLYTIFQQLAPLCQAVEDAMTVSGAEAYDAARVFYSSIKGATANNVAGSQAIYDDLSQRFPGKARKAKPPVNPA